MNDFKQYAKSYNDKMYGLLIIVVIMYIIILVDGFNLIPGFELGIKLGGDMFYLFWPLIVLVIGWGLLLQSYQKFIQKLTQNNDLNYEQDSLDSDIVPKWIEQYYPHSITKHLFYLEHKYYSAKIENGKYSLVHLRFSQTTNSKVKIPLQKMTIRHTKHVINHALDLNGVARLRGDEISINDIDIDSPAVVVEFNNNQLPEVPLVFVANRKQLTKMTLASTITEELTYNQEFIGYLCYDPENENQVMTFKSFILNNIELFNNDQVVLCAKDNILVYANPKLPVHINSDSTTKKATTQLFLSEEKILNAIEVVSGKNKQVTDAANILQTLNF